eukprot:803578-Rhodomonas_salina.1
MVHARIGGPCDGCLPPPPAAPPPRPPPRIPPRPPPRPPPACPPPRPAPPGLPEPGLVCSTASARWRFAMSACKAEASFSSS